MSARFVVAVLLILGGFAGLLRFANARRDFDAFRTAVYDPRPSPHHPASRAPSPG